MNWRRGLFRIWAVLSVVWLYITITDVAALSDDKSLTGIIAKAFERRDEVLLFPLGSLMSYYFIAWVVHGFRRRVSLIASAFDPKE